MAYKRKYFDKSIRILYIITIFILLNNVTCTHEIIIVNN